MPASQKPLRGTFRRERHERSEARSAAEEKLMREAKALDGFQCRRPRCPHCRNRAKTVTAAHRRDLHRAMGGNPALDRTRLEWLITLCVDSHDEYDGARLDIEPLDETRYFRGPCAWYRVNPETGEREHLATETTIGQSVAVGL